MGDRQSLSAFTFAIILLAMLVLQTTIAIPTSKAYVATPATVNSDALKSYKIVQYPLPQGSTRPWAIATDSSGNVWFLEQGSNQLGSYDPSTGRFSEYQIPSRDSEPQSLAVDSVGEIWFTELNQSKLAFLSPRTGKISEVNIPAGPSGISCGPIGVTPYSGEVWITCVFSNQIDEYMPGSGDFLEFDIPVLYSAPLQILFDNNGNFWFTAADANMIGFVNTANLKSGTSDGIEEFAPLNQTYVSTLAGALSTLQGPIKSSLWGPSQMAFSPDGRSLWITDHGGGSFDRYQIGRKTLVKYFTSRPNSSYPESLPNGIAVDSNGNVWIAEHYGNRIAEFDPSTGSLTEYPIPCCQSGISGTLYLALGVSGTVFFTEYFGNAIGELVPTAPTASLALSLGNSEVDVPAHGIVKVVLNVSTNQTEEAGYSPVTFLVSGITYTGEPQNLTVTFEPSDMILFESSTHETQVTLKTDGLDAGTYYLTIGARFGENGTVYSRILQLSVTQVGPDWPLILTVLGLSVCASLALLAIVRFKHTGCSWDRELPLESKWVSGVSSTQV